jgi:hypothetical protein
VCSSDLNIINEKLKHSYELTELILTNCEKPKLEENTQENMYINVRDVISKIYLLLNNQAMKLNNTNFVHFDKIKPLRALSNDFTFQESG